MAAGFSITQIPPLVNGRRYHHELENPKSIPEDIRFPALELLRTYHAAVFLNERTLSEASGTSAPARSEASTGTSITEMTFAFSANNGTVQPEAARRRLPGVQRARKALMRKLQACLEDCRKRKVKCQLWHHALRDLLEIEHSANDEIIVEWAIRYDADSQTPVATTPVSARVTVFDDIEARDDVIQQANTVFGLSGTPTTYSPDIHESVASLLGNPESVSPRPFMREDTTVPDAPSYICEEPIVSDVPPPTIYSIFNDELMFPLGSREPMIEPAHYSCWFPGCVQILPMQELISHFEHHHLHFQHLDDPLRMVCLVCETFYTYSNDQCLACYTPSGGLVEKLYGRYFPDATTKGLQQERVTVHSDFSRSWASGSPGPSWSPCQSSSPYPQNYGYGCSNNYPYVSSGSPGPSYYSKASSTLAQWKQNLFPSPIFSKRLFRSFLRHRKYITVLVLAATVSLVLGYKEHNWIVSTIAQLTHGMSTVSPSKLPFIGIVVGSIAFALHRIAISATHAGGIRTGWLSRCALNIFNVTCGQQRLGATSYDLGHSRS